jgi:hypothetical protein
MGARTPIIFHCDYLLDGPLKSPRHAFSNGICNFYFANTSIRGHHVPYWCRMTKLSAILFAIALTASMLLSASEAPHAPVPVLVELFTSEGCSSCPPADALLQQMERWQPVAGAQLIVLSEHVDYWNHDGWIDPFSSHFFTDRQNAYSGHFGLATAYTPEMVVDGSAEFVGSNGKLAIQACEKARAVQKISVRISDISLEKSDTLRAHIEADALPESFKARKADIYVALALNHAASQVLRGENAGHQLAHVAVVKSITKVGSVERDKSFARDVSVKLTAPADGSNLRVIAFVQEPGPGQVLGATLLRVQK